MLAYTFAAIGFLGAGYFIGKALLKEPLPTSSDRSTSPLSTLLSPQYANEKDFEAGLSKIVEIVGHENASFDKDVLLAQNDSFYSTHHPQILMFKNPVL